MRPSTLLVSFFFLFFCSLLSVTITYSQGAAVTTTGVGCPVVFDLIPLTSNGGEGLSMQVLQCPAQCQVADVPGEQNFSCQMPLSYSLIRPYYIEIGHPELETTQILLVEPHPTYGNNRLVISAAPTSPYILEPVMCYSTLEIYTADEGQLEVSIAFDLEVLTMYIHLSHNASIAIRPKKCPPAGPEKEPEGAASLRALPHHLTGPIGMKQANTGLQKQTEVIYEAALSNSSFRYTNPVTESLTIYMPESLMEDAEINIFTIQGQPIAKHQAPAGTYAISVPVSPLPSGMYALRVQYKNGSVPEAHFFIKL